MAGQKAFTRVKSEGPLVVAMTPDSILLSEDNGENWKVLLLPPDTSAFSDVAISPGPELWLASRKGMFRTTDQGATWKQVLGGLPPYHLAAIDYDAASQRFFAVTAGGDVYSSSDNGKRWQQQPTGFAVRRLTFTPNRLWAASSFEGVLAQSQAATLHDTAANPNPVAASGQ